jgi:riboflavin kinase/FMN adenylyltransferase
MNMFNDSITNRGDYSSGTAITVGVFDGVHRGHQKIIEALGNDRRKLAVTFYPHPDELFIKDKPFKYIQPLDERIETLKSCSIDEVHVLEFNYELAGTSPDIFMEYLINAFNLKKLVLGWDFALGKNRAGNYEVLKDIGDRKNIEVIQVPAVEYCNEVISSSAIRKAIMEGNLEKANGMMGRPFSITDTVIHGKHIGSDVLNIPTANFAEKPKQVLPPNGVYASYAIIDGVKHPSASFIGTRPTFNGNEKLTEIHILDECGDIYGKTITLEMIKFIRGEFKFANAQALADQINRDIKTINSIL